MCRSSSCGLKPDVDICIVVGSSTHKPPYEQRLIGLEGGADRMLVGPSRAIAPREQELAGVGGWCWGEQCCIMGSDSCLGIEGVSYDVAWDRFGWVLTWLS